MPFLGLAPGGVYTDARRYRRAGELLPRLFTLTADSAAVIFCCTFLEVTFTGRYPAPLPCGARTFLILYRELQPADAGQSLYRYGCDCLAYSHSDLCIFSEDPGILHRRLSLRNGADRRNFHLFYK